MGEILFTPESARAALAIGSVQATCNACGKRHFFDVVNHKSGAALRCCKQRVMFATLAVCLRHRYAFKRIAVLAEEIQVRSGLNVRNVPCLRSVRDRAFAMAIVADCGKPSFVSRAEYVFRLAQRVYIGAGLGGHYRTSLQPAFWALLSPAEDADREIGRICLDWGTDAALWADARQEIVERVPSRLLGFALEKYEEVEKIREAILSAGP